MHPTQCCALSPSQSLPGGQWRHATLPPKQGCLDRAAPHAPAGIAGLEVLVAIVDWLTFCNLRGLHSSLTGRDHPAKRIVH